MGVHTIGLQVRIENGYGYKHCGAIIEVLACNKIGIDWKIKRAVTLRSQVHQLNDQPTRWHGWHVVVRSSHDDHMILEGHSIPEAHRLCSDWHSSRRLGCDGVRSKRTSQV